MQVNSLQVSKNEIIAKSTMQQNKMKLKKQIPSPPTKINEK